MYNNNRISGSEKFGGARVVFTGTKDGITSGRYNIALDRVPDVVNGHIPAGTPLFLNDADRTADVHYAFEVVAGSTLTKTKVKKSLEGSRAMVGMVLMVAPATIDGTGAAVAITAIDRSNPEYDELTHASLADSSAEGTILVEASEAGADATVKVLPNSYAFYDLVKHPQSVEMWVDGLFIHSDGVLLERRVPPIAPIIKEYLASPTGGNTYVRYSKSQE